MLYLWLQRISLISNINIKLPSNKLLDEVKKVYKNNPSQNLTSYIWNSSAWLSDDFAKIINNNNIIDKTSMEKLDCVITQDELGLLNSWY